MTLRLNRIAHPITSLGFGSRVGLWLQGCHIHCAECSAKDTWDPRGGTELSRTELADLIAQTIASADLDGLTITGGEPTEQASEVSLLVNEVRHLVASSRDVTAHPFDVLVFSGRDAYTVQSKHSELWECADALICGPYKPERPSNIPLIASGNQTLSCNTNLAIERYKNKTREDVREIQFSLDDGDITLSGITGPGDLDLLESALKDRGIKLGGNSWTK